MYVKCFYNKIICCDIVYQGTVKYPYLGPHSA